MQAQLGGLIAAVRFLTCLPVPSASAGMDALHRALLYFPLVGLVMGGILVLIDALLALVFARPLVDFYLLAALVLLSGALHLDGLIDSADGLFSPGPAERRLAVMRESWAGPRGAAAALSVLLLQFAALRALPDSRVAALLLAPMLGRWAIVQAYVSYPYVRRTAGLSLALKSGASRRVGLLASLFVLTTASLLCWPLGPLLFGLAGLLTLSLGALAGQRLGGMSGDVYGGLEQVVETSVLLAMTTLAAGCPWLVER
jgi:adenosylcobinamide-GDP ribazoletransferase